MSSTRLHAQYNVYYRALSECAPLCKMVHGKISIGGFTAQSTRSSVAQICNLQTPKKPLSLPATCLYLSTTNSFSQKLVDLAWWCMKASCRGGDKAIEGAGQNGGNGCIRRLTIEAGSAYADHARSYIHLSEVCALCNPTCISKHVEVCALQANSISKHLAGRGRAKCQQ